MTFTVQQVQDQSEVWQNTAVGTRWYRCLDIRGREMSKLVQGGRTFTLTTFERQLNQQVAASPEQDLFRNGTFVLKKKSKDTEEDEVRTPNALTDHEIGVLANELQFGELGADKALEGIDSVVTLTRIKEALVINDAEKDLIEDVKARIEAAAPKVQSRTPVETFDPTYTTPDAPNERAPEKRQVAKTTPKDKPPTSED